MFEHLKNDPQFMRQTPENKNAWVENYLKTDVDPLVFDLPKASQISIKENVKKMFFKETERNAWEEFRDSSYDLVNSFARNAIGVAELPWDALEAVSGPGSVQEYAKGQLDQLNNMQESLVVRDDMRRYHDTASLGLGLNGLMGKVMYSFADMAGSWAQPFLKATTMTAERAAASTAFTGTLGDLALEGAMAKVIEPELDKTDWDVETKNIAKAGAYLLMGLGSGFTVEFKIDKLIGNPLYRNTIEEAVKRASAVNPKNLLATHYTPAEKAVASVVDHPDVVEQLAKLNKTVHGEASSVEHLQQAAQKISLELKNNAKSRFDAVESYPTKAFGELLHDENVGEILATDLNELRGLADVTTHTSTVKTQVQEALHGKQIGTTEELPIVKTKKPKTLKEANQVKDVKTQARSEMVLAEKTAFAEWAGNNPEQFKQIVQAVQKDKKQGEKFIREMFGVKGIPSHTKEAIHSHIEDYLANPARSTTPQVASVEPRKVEATKQPVVEQKPKTILREEPVQKSGDTTTPAPTMEVSVKKVAPVQPANLPEIRTKHNLPLRERVIEDPGFPDGVRRVVEFSNAGKPSNEQVLELQKAGGVFDRRYSAWLMPDSEETTKVLQQVRRMAAPPVDAKHAAPIGQFVTPKGDRVLQFSADLKPSEIQKTAMRANGIYWNSHYKGWLGADTEKIRQTMQQVTELANGGGVVVDNPAIKAAINAEETATKVRKAKQTKQTKQTTTQAQQTENPNQFLVSLESIPNNVKKWLERQNTTVQNGMVHLNDLHHARKNAYNFFKPGQQLPKAVIDECLQTLQDFETLLAKHARPMHEYDWREDLEKLRLAGVVTQDQHDVAVKMIDQFTGKKNFGFVNNQDLKDHYNLFTNVINLRDPKNLFHEVGHWAWWNALNGEDRVQFLSTVLKNFNEPSDWNRLWPMRKAMANLATRPGASATSTAAWNGPLQEVTELFADFTRQYVHSYRMTDEESGALIGKVLGEMEPVFAQIRALQDVPNEMRFVVDRILLRPAGEDALNINSAIEAVQSNLAYVDRNALEASMRTAVDGAFESAANDKMVDALKNQTKDLIGWQTSGDVEPVLNRALVDILGLFHFDTGDFERVDKLMQMLVKGFSTSGKENTIKALAKHEAGLLEMSVADPAIKQHVENLFQMYKQQVNDLAGLYEGVKYTKGHVRTSGSMTREGFVTHQLTLLQDAARRENQRVMQSFDEMTDDALGRAGFFDDTDAFRKLYGSETDDIWSGAGSSANVLMQWRLAPQLVSAMFGLETDSESGIPIPLTGVYLNWNPKTWATRGYSIGPMLSAYSLFGKGAKLGIQSGMMKLWNRYTPDQKAFLRMQFNSVAKHDYARAWLPQSGLREPVHDIQKAMWATESKVRRKVFDLADQMNKMPVEEQRFVGGLVSKEAAFDPTLASPQALAAQQTVEQLVHDTKSLLVTAGVDQKLLDDIGMDIIPQVFDKRLASWWKSGSSNRRIQSVHETLRTKFLAEQGRGETWKQNDPAVLDLIQITRTTGKSLAVGDMIEEFVDSQGNRLLMPQGMGGSGAVNNWRIKDINKRGQFVVHRKFNATEKAIMKEELSIVPRLVEFGENVSKFVAQAQMFKALSNNQLLAQDFEALRNAAKTPAERALLDDAEKNLMAQGWVEVPNTEAMKGIKRYGELAGKLVDPEVMYVLKVSTGSAPEHPLANALFQRYRQGVSLWKIGKTAFNPTTHGINFIGNIAMCAMDGRNPISVLKHGIEHLRTKGQFYQEAVNEGMVDSNILHSELGLSKWLHTLEQQPNQHTTHGFFGAAASWIDGVSKASKHLAKKAVHAPMKAYEYGDQVYKMGVFVQERLAGNSAKDAMAKANELFFDYRDVPVGVKAVRDWGILPFVSYTYKLLPRLAKFAAEKPHTVVGILAGMDLFNRIMMHNAFGEDFGDVQALYENIMPDWMNRGMFGTNLRGGLFLGKGKNQNGEQYVDWLDYSQVIPGATMMDDGGIFGGFPFGTNPVLSILYGLSSNKDAQIGNEIAPYPDAEAPAMKAANVKARLKFIARTLLPNLPVYPGAYSLERLGQGLTSEGVIPSDVANEMGWTGQDYYGTAEDGADAVVSWATGLRKRRLYPETEVARRFDKLSFGIKKQENELKRRLGDRRISQAELQQQTTQFNAVAEHNIQEMNRLSQVYKTAQKVLAQQKTGR